MDGERGERIEDARAESRGSVLSSSHGGQLVTRHDPLHVHPADAQVLGRNLKDSIFIELITSDRNLEAFREGSKGRINVT